jgi:hypothetical protein
MPALPLYRESQRLRQAWVIGLALTPAFVAWYVFIGQVVLGRTVGNNPAPDWAVWLIFALVGVGLPAALFTIRLIVDVTDAAVTVRFGSLVVRWVSLGEVQSAKVVKYRPLRQFWGWGIRWSPHDGWAYTASGNHGVRVTLNDGRSLLIGSQRPGELAESINARLACPGSSPR